MTGKTLHCYPSNTKIGYVVSWTFCDKRFAWAV